MKDDSPARQSRGISSVLLMAGGTLCVGLGLVGAVIPVLPTTPFLLLAAACYLRSSKRLYRWITTNRLFGEQLRRYREGEGLTRKVKGRALTLLWTGLVCSSLFTVPRSLLWVHLVLLVVGIGVTIHIVSLPTYKRERRHSVTISRTAARDDNLAERRAGLRNEGEERVAGIRQ
ncbi:MAG: YbaN family protein [Spirochaetia bacterium]|nr:YbaN family protein [Spirochaetia bacterium]